MDPQVRRGVKIYPDLDKESVEMRKKPVLLGEYKLASKIKSAIKIYTGSLSSIFKKKNMNFLVDSPFSRKIKAARNNIIKGIAFFNTESFGKSTLSAKRMNLFSDYFRITDLAYNISITREINVMKNGSALKICKKCRRK